MSNALLSAQALKLQRGTGMKRFTAVFLAALSLAALSGCGLEADEVVDENGNVQKISSQSQALESSDPTTNPDPGSDDSSPPLLVLPTSGTGGGTGGTSGDPVVNPRSPGVIALPQDPIPLVDPAKPQPTGGPRVGPQGQLL